MNDIRPTLDYRATPKPLTLIDWFYKSICALIALVLVGLAIHYKFNWLQWLLVSLFAVFAAVLFISRKFAGSYLRVAALLGISVVMLLPFVWLACAAFKDRLVMNEYTFLPSISTWIGDHVWKEREDGKPTLIKASELAVAPKEDDIIHGTLNMKNYTDLFTARESTQGPIPFWRYIVNSLFLACTGTVTSLFFCSLGGYALAKYQFRGRSILLTFMLASLMVPGVVFLVPNWEIIWRMGWMDSYKGLLIPGLVGVFGMFLFRQAMLDIPTDLIEAGRIDGCGEFRIYFSLVMPLVRPMIGAFCLISFLGAWNSFIGPSMYLQTQYKQTLPVVLNQYIGLYTQQYGVFLAGTLLAIIPPAILFFALQREFISGLQSGALKQ